MTTTNQSRLLSPDATMREPADMRAQLAPFGGGGRIRVTPGRLRTEHETVQRRALATNSRQENGMHDYMKLLSMEATDLVTGFSGIVSTVGFDLYGCVQCVVTPKLTKDGPAMTPETLTMLASLVNTDANLTKLIRDVENFVDAAGIAALVKWQDSVRATIAKAVGDAP